MTNNVKMSKMSLKIEYLNKKQIDEAIAKAANYRYKDYLRIKTLAQTGLRASELVGSEKLPGLKLQDINVLEGTIIVNGKGNKYRTVDSPKELCQQLKMYCEVNNIKKNARIFPITREALWYCTKKIAGVNPHVFRHSYTIYLLRQTKNVRYVQKQLGHSSLSTTQHYLKYMEFDEEKNAIDVIF
jgi:integrase